MYKPTTRYVMTGEDLIFQAMDLPTTNLFFNDVDVPSSAIPINTSGAHSWDDEIFPELHRFEKLLSTSPNTFVNSEYGANLGTSQNVTTANGSSGTAVVPCPTAKAIPDNVRLRNHDCMWSGRCNQQESHQKMKLKAAAAAAAAAAASQGKRVASKLPTPAQSPTKVRTIQAGESLLRQKQPNSSSGASSGDENNNNRPDTPQSLGGGEEQDINCTTTGSNHLPLLLSKEAAKEQEVNKIKEYLSDPAKQQYKAFDTSTTLADVINTLESGEFSKRDANGSIMMTGGGGGGGGRAVHNTYPMSPADESDCSSRSLPAMDDDTESEHEMDDEYSLQDDDEGISLKMMPTSHLSSRMSGYDTSSLSRMSMGSNSNSTMRMHGQGSSDEEDEEDDEEEEEEVDVKPDVNVLMQQTGVYHQEYEEDSGTERSLYGTTLTVQEKNLIKQQTSMHSDHCYTRVKSRVDIQNLGVETPSDSEEEIDVGGGLQKNLPTNPSAKDRKALQATVRNRFVRNPSGIVTAPPTVPNSGTTTPGGRYYNTSSGVTATMKKVGSSKQRSYAKLDDYYVNADSQISSSGRKIVGSQVMRSKSSGAGRKRPAASSVGSMGYSKSSKHYHDSKKGKYSGAANGGVKGSSRPLSKGYNNDYRSSLTTFTIEKRNLHNDLERQRRVGLKNLFEELKNQIPSLRDKERAPKVSILREAALLCDELSREQEMLFALRKQRERLLQTARMLKTQLQRSAARAK